MAAPALVAELLNFIEQSLALGEPVDAQVLGASRLSREHALVCVVERNLEATAVRAYVYDRYSTIWMYILRSDVDSSSSSRSSA